VSEPSTSHRQAPAWRKPVPEQLRRYRGKPVAAQDRSFWEFGPPLEGKGPKPIRFNAEKAARRGIAGNPNSLHDNSSAVQSS